MTMEPATEARRWPGKIPVRHRYTPGLAATTFFEALRDRAIFLGSSCAICERTYVPPRLFCERCFGELFPDTEVGPAGELVSVTVGKVGADGEPLHGTPIALGLVRLDRATSCLVHFLIRYGGDPPPIGTRVEAIFRPHEERTGSILDVLAFTPARSQSE